MNVAIIGGGLMGREIASALLRWPALIDHPVRPRVTAVCDVNPSAMEWFGQIESVTRMTTDYRELLDDASIDVIYVAVRHDLHEAIYTDIIRAGKDLLAEKPFGIDLGAARRMLAEMQSHPQSFVRCSSEMPFFPGAQLAMNVVRSGGLGQIVEVRSAFLHSSDVDPNKPINWKRQVEFCGGAGVMNDLGLHAWHVPLRLGWVPTKVFATLQNLVQHRPGPDGHPVPCDTWDNAVVQGWVDADGQHFPLTVETKRIAPGEKNTWLLEVIGTGGGVRFTTKRPATLEVFQVADIDGVGREQVWRTIDVGSQSAWATVTGGIFETGFSDAILQMWAVFLAERDGLLGARFGAATPDEVAHTHAIYAAAARAHAQQRAVEIEPIEPG